MRRTPRFALVPVDVIADGADGGAERDARPRAAPPFSAACVAGDRRPRCDASRAARAHARGAAGRSSDRAGGRRDRSIARRRGGQSSRAARCSTRRRLPRSHRGAPCGRRSGNSETARAGAAQRRLLLGKHRGDLALRRAVDARVRPVRIPAIEIGLRLVERLEAHPVQRRLLRVADPRLRLSLCDRDRRPDTAARRPRSARARRDRAD